MSGILLKVRRLVSWKWMLALGVVAHGILILTLMAERALLCAAFVVTFRPEGHPECAIAFMKWHSILFYTHVTMTVLLLAGWLLGLVDRTGAAFCYLAITAVILVAMSGYMRALSPLRRPPRQDVTGSFSRTWEGSAGLHRVRLAEPALARDLLRL